VPVFFGLEGSLDKIHILHARKFCRPTSGVVVLKQSRYSASIKRVLLYISSCVNRDTGTGVHDVGIAPLSFKRGGNRGTGALT